MKWEESASLLLEKVPPFVQKDRSRKGGDACPSAGKNPGDGGRGY